MTGQPVSRFGRCRAGDLFRTPVLRARVGEGLLAKGRHFSLAGCVSSPVGGDRAQLNVSATQHWERGGSRLALSQANKGALWGLSPAGRAAVCRKPVLKCRETWGPPCPCVSGAGPAVTLQGPPACRTGCCNGERAHQGEAERGLSDRAWGGAHGGGHGSRPEGRWGPVCAARGALRSETLPLPAVSPRHLVPLPGHHPATEVAGDPRRPALWRPRAPLSWAPRKTHSHQRQLMSEERALRTCRHAVRKFTGSARAVG